VDAASLDETGNPHGHAAPNPAISPEAKELAIDLEKMGPVFIKIGQLLSTRPDLLPVPFTEALARLQDKVAPFPFEEVEKIVSSELGMRLSRAFSAFDPVPVSAASLGQVHRAAMRDGRPVAVKVQRPGIREKMADDLDCLQEVAEFLDHHTHMGKQYEFEKMLAEFRKTLLHELDYRLESQNLRTLGANLAEFKRIIVPQPIEDFTTSRVLTMEYIGGHKITTLSQLAKMEMDGIDLAAQLFKAYMKQILVDGFYHADPHPGNILLTDDSSIALIDLGMVGRLSPKLREGLLLILLAVSEGRGEDTADQMIAISEKKEDFNGKPFTRKVVELVDQNHEKTLQQISMGKIVLEINKMAVDSGIRVPVEMATLAKTLLNLDEVGRTLDPKFNPNEAIRSNAISVMRRRMTSGFTTGSLFAGFMEAKELFQHMPGKVSKILDAVANNEFKVTVDALDETKLMSGFQKVANRITVGLVMAALIIGAALMMRVETPLKIFGYPGIAMILFLIAAAGGIIVLLQILFYDEHS
jgi:predicted unusual protein kinase regulating ubiquinone biosynthesis (AarF/ABC1/UbiB family)